MDSVNRVLILDTLRFALLVVAVAFFDSFIEKAVTHTGMVYTRVDESADMSGGKLAYRS